MRLNPLVLSAAALGAAILLQPALLSAGFPVQSAEEQAAAAPQLAIRSDTGETVFTTAQLLARKDLETLTIQDVSAYPRQTMTFRAVKMASLLKEVAIEPGDEVQFVATDGFGTTFRPELLQNTAPDKAIAYLAVEDPQAKWPNQRNKSESAGPYYLFWVHPELSGIGREQYPYLIDHVAITRSTAARFPKILPDPALAADDPVRRGYASFEKNCLTCHTINGQGPGSMGPDLNSPMSPTEYFQPGILRRLIRNSQSIRANPNTPMGPFPPEILPDGELDDLIAYLTHMAKRRGDAPVAADESSVRAVVTRSLMSWQSGDRTEFAATTDPKLVFAFPGRRTDAAGAMAVFDKWKADYRDVKVYIHRILVDGDRFAAEYQFANTPVGGKRTVTGTLAVGRVQDGRIVELKEYLDGRVSRAQEAGWMPVDEGKEPYPWPAGVDLRDIRFPEMPKKP
ncbi:c-type cytochrome [Sphingomonas sp.]|uniref:c-type cytochrome n=1 Tax=Sphingomonas sp. TaxID=28214 RepID=UPI001B2E088F|nr:c-type cytochrome [Sphingomonas sp.]MBO9711662.1 c-type cytochrome [Sphingomonas sp.]